MQIKRMMTEDGVPLLLYRIELPDALGAGEAALLSALTERAVAYLEGELTERMRQSYLSSNDRGKRFSFLRLDYRLRIFRSQADTLTLSFSAGRGSATLGEGELSFAVAPDGKALPIGMGEPRRKRQKKKAKMIKNACKARVIVI
jgi:hypothetical protein